MAPLARRLGGRRRTAFIFSGGGSLGAVQVGMLRALVEAGISPDLVIGCSVGAINGAGFAAEPNLRGVARLERIWRKLASGDPEIMPGGFIPLAVQLARKGESLHDPVTLQGLLEEELPAVGFDELRVPFECVATDVETATEHWFNSGPLVPALLASAALPAVYPAMEFAGRTYIDGGVLNEVHTDRAAELGATDLYVLHVGHLDERATDVQRPFDSALRAYWTARRFRLEENLRRVPTNCTVHRLPSGAPPRLRFDDFTMGPDLAELAYTQTSEYLQTGRMPAPVTVPSGSVSTPEDPGDEQLPPDGLETPPVLAFDEEASSSNGERPSETSGDEGPSADDGSGELEEVGDDEAKTSKRQARSRKPKQ